MTSMPPADDRSQPRTETERWRRFLLDTSECESSADEAGERDRIGEAPFTDESVTQGGVARLTPDRDLPGAISLFTLAPLRRTVRRIDEGKSDGAESGAGALASVGQRLGQLWARRGSDDDRTQAAEERRIPPGIEPARRREMDP